MTEQKTLPDLLGGFRTYILDSNNHVKYEPDPIKWHWWMARRDSFCQVAATTIGLGIFARKIRVSTIFLGIDHNFYDEGEPHVFETCVFSRGTSEIVQRYSSWNDALEGHNKTVDYLRGNRIAIGWKVNDS